MKGWNMKRILLLAVILVMFVMPPAVSGQTQSAWSGLAVGWTTDYFNSEPMKNVLERVRIEVSPVIRLSDKVWTLPQIDWATNNGLVRATGVIYTHVYTYKTASFYAGGSISPLQVLTDGVVKINSQASVGIDVGATWHVMKGVLLGIAVRQEISEQIGETEPLVKSPNSVTTLKIGIIGIL